MNPDFINPLVLAYLGDSVLELLVREYLINNDLQKVNELYQKATHYVSSKAHEDFILYILEQNFLTEKEVGIFKRGRNTKTNKRDSKEHLYLNNQQERIYEIFDEFKKRVNELENEEI